MYYCIRQVYYKYYAILHEYMEGIVNLCEGSDQEEDYHEILEIVQKWMDNEHEELENDKKTIWRRLIGCKSNIW